MILQHHFSQPFNLCELFSFAFDHSLAVGVLRLSKGFDFSAQLKQPVIEMSKSQLGLSASCDSATHLCKWP